MATSYYLFVCLETKWLLPTLLSIGGVGFLVAILFVMYKYGWIRLPTRTSDNGIQMDIINEEGGHVTEDTQAILHSW